MTATNGPPDAERFVALYEASVDDVYRYASRLTGGDRAATDELVQETYLAVLRRPRSGESIELSTGYLIVACRHRHFDALRARGRRASREQRWAGRDAPSAADADIDADGAATAALADLPDDQRSALVLRYVDELSVAEISALMGRSVRAVESLLARGRTTLRSRLKEHEDERR